MLAKSEPVLGIVVEVQLARDPAKKFTWPLYAAALRARLRAAACVLVVTCEQTVAAWAAEPIDLGAGSLFIPLVVGPSAVPVVGPGEARLAPELAVLAALAHAGGPRGIEAALAAIDAVQALDAERSTFYYDLVMSALPDAARLALEEWMQPRKYQYQSEFARRYFGEGLVKGREEGREEGLAQGKAQSLLAILAARGVPVSDTDRQRILACRDAATLERWIARAVSAGTISDVIP